MMARFEIADDDAPQMRLVAAIEGCRHALFKIRPVALAAFYRELGV